MADFNSPYDAVIADLEARRAELDSAISLMKRLKESISGWGGIMIGPMPAGSVVATPPFQAASMDMDAIPSDAFFNMTIVDAAVKFLSMWANRKPQDTKTIIDAFSRGGLKGKAYSTVYGVLNRRKDQVGDIVNVNGDWGLADWYGGQKGKKQQRKAVSMATFEKSEGAEDSNELVPPEPEDLEKARA